MAYNAQDYRTYMDGIENSGTASYTIENAEGSGAYGRYQFMPKTAERYATQLGIPMDQWKVPANQDKMFDAMTADNIKNLQDNYIPVNNQTVYGTHQQGAGGFRKVWYNKMDGRRDNLISNLPKDQRAALANATDAEVRDAWMSKYMSEQESYPGSDSEFATTFPAAKQSYTASQAKAAQEAVAEQKRVEAEQAAAQNAAMDQQAKQASIMATQSGVIGQPVGLVNPASTPQQQPGLGAINNQGFNTAFSNQPANGWANIRNTNVGLNQLMGSIGQ